MWNRRQFNQMVAGGIGLLAGGASSAFAQAKPPKVVKHFEVYREPGQYAGWPANHGAWQWGNEFLFGFELGSFKETDRGHAIDYSKPAEHVLARSLDGGETWAIERPASLQPPADSKVAGVPTGAGGKQPTQCAGGIDFSHRDFAFTARMLDIHVGPSRFYYSMDRGKTWEGPFHLELPQIKGIAARTDYLILGKQEMLLFVTIPKADGREGRPIVLRTRDGGGTWTMQGQIGPQPEPGDYSIMPATVRMGPKQLITAVRHRGGIELFGSETLGETWYSRGVVAENLGGNPASLVRTLTGQLVLIYGYRNKPFGIRAKISENAGYSWGDELRLRTDGGGWDLGYVRTFQRQDGNLVSVYYYNDAKSPERYIAGTIWYPGDFGYRIMDRRFSRQQGPVAPPNPEAQNQIP